MKERELEGLDHDDVKNNETIALIKEKIAALKKQTTAIGTLVSDDKPCYFNSGCCSYADGDITGLELASGKISLVKWSNQGLKTIESESIHEIFELL